MEDLSNKKEEKIMTVIYLVIEDGKDVEKVIRNVTHIDNTLGEARITQRGKDSRLIIPINSIQNIF